METIAEMQARLAAYKASELKILQSQESQNGQGGTARRNRRPELDSVRAEIRAIKADIAAAEAAGAGRRMYNLVPR